MRSGWSGTASPYLKTEGDDMDTLKTLQRLVFDKVGRSLESIDDIQPEKSFDELGADSLDKVEIVMDIEDEFLIAISDEEAEAVKTISDAMTLISAKIEKKRKK